MNLTGKRLKKLLMKYLILTAVISLNFLNVSLTQDEIYFADSTAAMEHANANDSKILMVFSGSDWCRPCIQFKNDILLTETFKEYVENKIAILYLDFPAKKKNKLSKEQTAHNELLAEKFNKSGAFPHLVLMDAEMKKLKDLKFSGQSVDSFIKELND